MKRKEEHGHRFQQAQAAKDLDAKNAGSFEGTPHVQ